MNSILQKKTPGLLNIISLLLLFVFFISCKKDINTNANTNTPEVPENKPDLTTKVTSSVSGFVTDQNDAPVIGAEVKAGPATVITDRYGYFEIKNVQVVKEAATVTVSYNGYFKTIKTYMATEGKAAFFRLKLLQKTIIGTVNANAGGSVSLSNGVNISFPANGIKDAISGVVYNGTVNVAAQYLDPTSPELNKIMPGDLRGLNTSGNMKGLTSYGMMGVELTGDAGQTLQMADGKKSTITMPMPATISPDAPSSIPLWHFDETNGLWQEEGSATKTGSNYIGEVSHFSWWNCDLPNATVPLTFTIVDSLNRPVGNVHVEIVPLTSNSWSHVGGYTDSSGYVSVPLTANAQYRMDLYGEGCGTQNSLYSKTFSIGTDAFSLGNITIAGGTAAYVTGTATDCSNNPLAYGRIIISDGSCYWTCLTNHDGSYNLGLFMCTGTTSTGIIAEDLITLKQSATQSFILVNGTNHVNNLQACAVNSDTYLRFTINGRTFVSWTNYDEAKHYQLGGDSSYTNIYWNVIETANGAPVPNSGTNVEFDVETYGPVLDPASLHYVDKIYVFAPGFMHYTRQVNPLSYYTNGNYREIQVNITEYGNVGEFVAGSYSGRFYEDMWGPPDMTIPYDVTCSFRVRRTL